MSNIVEMNKLKVSHGNGLKCVSWPSAVMDAHNLRAQEAGARRSSNQRPAGAIYSKSLVDLKRLRQ